MVKEKHLHEGGSFKTHKTFSPQEILAAGGTTVFGHKAQKNNASLTEALENAPTIEPFSEDEWNSLQNQFTKNK